MCQSKKNKIIRPLPSRPTLAPQRPNLGEGERGLSNRVEGLKERRVGVSRHCIVGKAGIGGWEEDTFGKLMKVRRGLMKDQCIALLSYVS